MQVITPNGQVSLSVVVMAYEMRTQVMRTLEALARGHQQGIGSLDYEVVVVDNGPVHEPLDAASVTGVGPEFRLIRPEHPAVSPARVLNAAVAECRGAVVAIILDGACLVTPGVLSKGMQTLCLDERIFATTFAWHLGTDLQTKAMAHGYGLEAEEALLARAGWAADGYALFREAAIDPSNPLGWFGPIVESRFMLLPRVLWDELGGYDERFEARGGGLMALDLFRRVSTLPGVQVVGLLGEGSFHQFHGGVTTNSIDDHWSAFHDEYKRIIGTAWSVPTPDITYFGDLSEPARAWVGASRVADHFEREMWVGGAAVPLLGARLHDAVEGFHLDNWVAPKSEIVVVSREGSVVEVEGWLPGDEDAHARLVVGGVAIAGGPISAGVFTLRGQATLAPDEPVPIVIEIDSVIPESLRADDDRSLSWQVGVVRVLPAFLATATR